mmetsp:Transcript_18968/g.56524  ORF Transcript_18968/g.56524 Transcript_18968/m.56524 type:complete len:245 (-) Transcript_18968:411-1145(-)
MGSIYLKRYIDRVADVPVELRRHLALIRDLDEKAQQLQQEIEANSTKTTLSRSKAAKSRDAHGVHGYDLASAVTKLVSLADEKVTIAAQVYDFIDKHIQKLDEDLRTLDGEIRADRQRLRLADDERATDRLEAGKPRGRGRPPSAVGADAAGQKKRGRKRANPEPPVPEETDPIGSHLLPVQQENEPLYCYCQKPSHGEMVACDNDECALEWFHYECVGLTAAPVGQWYCPDCTKIMEAKAAAV